MRPAFHRSKICRCTTRWASSCMGLAEARDSADRSARACCWGRKHLIDGALANASPWEGAIGRPMKVGKEEIMGCLAAVEAWQKRDLNALKREGEQRVKRIATLAAAVPGVSTHIKIPEGGNRYPTLTVSWDEAAWKFSVADCDEALRAGTPRIEVLTSKNPSMVRAAGGGEDGKTPKRGDRLQIISMTLQPGEDLTVGNRLREILSNARKKGGQG